MKAPPDADSPQPAACKLPARRLVKLTPEQYDRTVKPLVYTGGSRFSDAWKSTVGSYSGFFSNHADRLDMTSLHVWRVFEESLVVATRATDGYSLYQFGNQHFKDSGRFKCPADGPNEDCVTKYLTDWGARMYRRKLEPAELERYVGFFRDQSALHGAKRAYELVIQALLLSPHVLYRTEIGTQRADGSYELTASEKAQALSYLIADAPPDAELSALAETDALSREEIAKQAARLLAQRPSLKSSWPDWQATGGALGIDKFFAEYFQFGKIKFAPKGWRYSGAFNPKKEQSWDYATAHGAAETRHFLHDWFWETTADAKTLLSADYTFVNSELAGYYGIPLAAPVDKDAPFVKAPLPPYRRGLLTQVAFLGTYGKEWNPDLVHRGLYIREKLLCGKVPAPPPDVPSAASLDKSSVKTYNELVEEHSNNSKCVACHRFMDPLGRPFQSFDSAGIHRTVDNDMSFANNDPKLERPLGRIDGEIFGTEESDTTVTDAAGLISKLAESKDVQHCLGLNFYRYAQAREEVDTDSCSLRTMYEKVAQKKGNMREVLVDIVTADDFVLRSQE